MAATTSQRPGRIRPPTLAETYQAHKERLMLHSILIIAHAACGLTALATGIFVLRPHAAGVSLLFRVYLGALWLMVLFLILVVALDWPQLAAGTMALYGALTLFALYVGWRGWNAPQHLRHPAGNWRAEYIDDVGFTVIALFDGFVIISALDLGAPVWLVLVIAALGILIGRYGVQRAQEMAAT
jgi:hypothetical protein